jgi:hypothetical protein
LRLWIQACVGGASPCRLRADHGQHGSDHAYDPHPWYLKYLIKTLPSGDLETCPAVAHRWLTLSVGRLFILLYVKVKNSWTVMLRARTTLYLTHCLKVSRIHFH